MLPELCHSLCQVNRSLNHHLKELLNHLIRLKFIPFCFYFPELEAFIPKSLEYDREWYGTMQVGNLSYCCRKNLMWL